MYGLKEKNLAKAYIRVIPLGLKDPDALRLLQWKRPTEKEVRRPPFETPSTQIFHRGLPREISHQFSTKSSANAHPSSEELLPSMI